MLSDAKPITFAALVVAPFVGSFLAVVAVRLPQHRSIALGRSRCDACGRQLQPWELVPLVSFTLLLGRCRGCTNQISPLHPIIESAALVIAAWAAFIVTGWVLVASCLLGWILLVLAVIDWRVGLLPDILTLPLLAMGLIVAAAIDRPSVIDHAIGAVVGFVAFAVVSDVYRRIRHREGLGLGDAKLLAAGGAWLSWSALPTVVLFAACIALVLVLVQRPLGRGFHVTDRIAFGPALAAAIWLVWLYGPLLPY